MINRRIDILLIVIKTHLFQECKQKKKEKKKPKHFFQCHVPNIPLNVSTSFFPFSTHTFRGLDETITTNTKDLILNSQ